MSNKVAVVTGGARGLGLHHAVALAEDGYDLVINDIGVSLSGDSGSATPAEEAVDRVCEFGIRAVVDTHDVASWDGSRALISTALESFGRIDVLVNNAGILRDRMIVSQSDEDWDDVINVHLRGTIGPLRAAANWWRDQHKAGSSSGGRVINTTSTSGLFGNVGQSNYGSAKAGVAALTIIAAEELARYGVRVNAIAPGARTRMTEGLIEASAGPYDPYDPVSVARLVSWLAGPAAHDVSGEVFFVQGGILSVLQGWRSGPTHRQGAPFTREQFDDLVPRLLGEVANRDEAVLLEGEKR